MNSTSYKISARLRHILLSVVGSLVRDPPDLQIRNRDERLVERMELILAQFPGLQRFFMCLGILFFDRAGCFFGYGLRRFVNMDEDTRRCYVAAWSHTHSTLLHEFYKGIRGLVLVCYFSHTDIWEYIGYTPYAYVAERIALRRELTGEVLPDLAPRLSENAGQ